MTSGLTGERPRALCPWVPARGCWRAGWDGGKPDGVFPETSSEASASGWCGWGRVGWGAVGGLGLASQPRCSGATQAEEEEGVRAQRTHPPRACLCGLGAGSLHVQSRCSLFSAREPVVWFLVLYSKHNSRVGNLWGTLAGDLPWRLTLPWPLREPLAPRGNSSVWPAPWPVSVLRQH